MRYTNLYSVHFVMMKNAEKLLGLGKKPSNIVINYMRTPMPDAISAAFILVVMRLIVSKLMGKLYHTRLHLQLTQLTQCLDTYLEIFALYVAF